MEITFTLNGKKVTPQIDADTLLIDLVRDLGCYSVNVDARHQIADYVRYLWMTSQSYHVPFLQQELMDIRSIL